MGFLLAPLGVAMLFASVVGFRVVYKRDWTGLYEAITGFGLGGSAIALFGRVGGGIYTKARACVTSRQLSLASWSPLGSVKTVHHRCLICMQDDVSKNGMQAGPPVFPVPCRPSSWQAWHSKTLRLS